jgi:PPOX class probable F420-dependent enzyme
MTPEEARARFVDARVAHLATAGADGRPHVVPITFALEGDRILTAVDAKPKREGPLRRIENILVNPSVAVLADVYDADWTRLWWARADGVASVVSGGASLQHVIALLRARYPQYGDTDIPGPAIVIRVERWSGWSASGG